jgi:hypothetical protein
VWPVSPGLVMPLDMDVSANHRKETDKKLSMSGLDRQTEPSPDLYRTKQGTWSESRG